MTIIIGHDKIIQNIKLEDLYIPQEVIKMLMRISSDETDKSEYIGIIKHNNNRYINYQDEIPIIELCRGKSTDNFALLQKEHNSQFEEVVLNFHTHPIGKGKHNIREASIEDCEMFSALKRSIGARFFAIVTNNIITLYDFSDIKSSQTHQCDNNSNICECLKEIGIKEYTLDGTEDVLLIL